MSSLTRATVAFLLRNDQVLLGYKKTGFGQGKYVGIGGKIEQGETPQQAAIREIFEEITVTHPRLHQMAELTFLFPEKPSWSQHVTVFTCHYWQGDPQESSEIKPEWQNREILPFDQMWDDARLWLPAILAGQQLTSVITFSPDLKVVTNEVILSHF